MRWAEIQDNYKVYISNDESSLSNRIKNEGKVFKKDLSENDIVVADRLVNKSVLLRKRTGKDVYFVRNTPE